MNLINANLFETALLNCSAGDWSRNRFSLRTWRSAKRGTPPLPSKRSVLSSKAVCLLKQSPAARSCSTRPPAQKSARCTFARSGGRGLVHSTVWWIGKTWPRSERWRGFLYFRRLLVKFFSKQFCSVLDALWARTCLELRFLENSLDKEY